MAYLIIGGRFGEVNPKGVLFYNNIIDNMLLKGMLIYYSSFQFNIVKGGKEGI